MTHLKSNYPNAQFPEALLPLRETLAEQVHDTWMAGRLSEGWKYGPVLDQSARTHPCLVPYEQLPESEKEYDRRTAAVTILCILNNGYTIQKSASAPDPWPAEVPQQHIFKQGKEQKKLDYGLLLTSAPAVQWYRADAPDAPPRIPKERTTVYHRGLPFPAAGRLYRNLSQLTVMRKPGPPSPWYLDRYGRKVFHVWEGVPKFDSYDSSDHRGYQWYFLCENGVLTRIFSSGDSKILVTEDVAFLEWNCWRDMERCGYLEAR